MLELDTAIQVLDGYKPQSVQDYERAFAKHLARHRRQEQPQDIPLKAGIDCGRYVVNCECGGGIALHPDWQFAACFTCGRSWKSVVFPSPEFMQQLEEILRCRPAGTIRKDQRRWWSWWPDETLEQLIDENIRHGWPVPQRT